MRFHAFGGRFELCAWEFMLFWPLWEMPWWDVMLFGCRLFFLMVWCKDGGEGKEAGDWVYAMAYWTLRSFACTSWVVRWWGGWEAEGFAWKWSDSCHQHAWHQADTYVWEDDVTWPEHAVGIEEWCWWSDACNLKNVYLLWAVTVFWSGFLRLLVLRVDCESNRPSFLVTVFDGASAFNGDLDQWDVAKVTTMNGSKSIRIVENYVTWRELMPLWLEGSVGGLGWWW